MYGLNLGRLGLVGRRAASVSNITDLFIITGQSNAVGIGSSAQSPAAPYGLYISGSTITSPLADPVGNANTGSAWPSFSNEWAIQTNHKSAFVSQAVIASGLVASGSYWSPTGLGRASAVTACNSAIAAINASGTYTLGNVYFIWLQGEQEAAAINGTTITGDTYRQALEDLAAYWKTQVPTMSQVGMINISGNGSGSSISAQSALNLGFQEIRAGQKIAAANSANITPIYDGTYHLLGRGLLSDGTHYSQAGYNITGKMAAKGMAGTIGSLSVSGPVISTASYASSPWGFTTQKTVSHTTPANTSMLIVAVGSHFHDSTLATTLSATYNGVALKYAAMSQVVGAPAKSATAAIFYIDDAAYGSSLAGVTANLVINSTNNQTNIDFCVLNAKDIAACDSESGAFPASAAPGSADVSCNLTTMEPSLVVAVASAAAPVVSAVTATWTGATECFDASLSNGTYATASTVAYIEEAAPVTSLALTATWTAQMSHRAMTVVAFRAKYIGE